MPCCQAVNDSDGAIWKTHFPSSTQCALTAAAASALILLIIGSIALVGLHNATSALAPFGSAIGGPAAIALLAIGALGSLLTLAALVKSYRSYQEACKAPKSSLTPTTRRPEEDIPPSEVARTPTEEEFMALLDKPLTEEERARLDDLQRRVEEGEELSVVDNATLKEYQARQFNG